jgi:hypothetical protein
VDEPFFSFVAVAIQPLLIVKTSQIEHCDDP